MCDSQDSNCVGDHLHNFVYEISIKISDRDHAVIPSEISIVQVASWKMRVTNCDYIVNF